MSNFFPLSFFFENFIKIKNNKRYFYYRTEQTFLKNEEINLLIVYVFILITIVIQKSLSGEFKENNMLVDKIRF